LFAHKDRENVGKGPYSQHFIFFVTYEWVR
jgi:hypothetical protein